MDKIIAGDGIDIHCRVDQPDEPGADRPWLVFSNSLMTSLSLWDEQIPVLKHRYRILRYDQRGHGKTTVPRADCDFELLSGDLMTLFEAFGIARAVVVGVSLGAITALRFAGRFPERVTAVVISDATAASVPGAGAAWDERIALAGKHGMTALAGPTVERWFSPASMQAETAAVRRVRDMIAQTPYDGFVRAAAALRSFDFNRDLETLTCPAMLVVGARDGALPGVMRKMADQLPGASFAEIPEAGHLPNIERPDAFNRRLLDFLEQVDSGKID